MSQTVAWVSGNLPVFPVVVVVEVAVEDATVVVEMGIVVVEVIGEVVVLGLPKSIFISFGPTRTVS